ncbi:MAG: FAD-dependent oxidoreductase, partial [Firmicutes bacterium]|nr:FAD-dependent oxidoreductase [Bacillota bacterium]
SGSEDSLFDAGTYTATVKGHNGDITVEVEFDKSSIVAVKVLDHSESAGIADAPIERIPQEVVSDQTLVVDTITGATVTSSAILAAIEDCVVQANGDVAALKANGGNGTGQSDTELTTDIVVVGAGGAGLSAAISAQENGASVIVLEKLAMVGGSTARSGGGISATGTKFQEELGIEDTKESWMDLWVERQAVSNPDGKYPDYTIVDKFMDAAVVTTEWLVDYIGHEYGRIEGFGLDPVERIHFPAGEGGGGAVLIQNMEKFALDKGIEILTETAAVEIIIAENGNAVGVIAEGKEGKVTINAKKVIMAAGGFAKSEELLTRFVPEAAGSAELSTAGAGSTGDGILMAEEVGAALYEEPWVMGVGIATKIDGTGSLGFDWTKLYVNGEGNRFSNEEMHYAIATNDIIAQDEPWLILNATEANEGVVTALEDAMPSDEIAKGDTLEALAEAMGVPVDAFVQTIKTFNEGVKTGNDAMGKHANYLVAVDTAPYYAIKLYPRTMGTFAGVKTNEIYQVVREDGTIINNLYAAGENANKVIYNQVYMSGSAVQFALTSGRLAGEHAAQNLN